MLDRTLRSLRSKLRFPTQRSLVPVSSQLDYVRNPALLGEGHRLQLLVGGGEAFPAMLGAIAGAKRHVHFETYILRSDRTGARFQAALIERALAGVRVRLLYDSLGSFGLVSTEYLSELAKAGVEIVEYHPITPWRRRLIERLRKVRGSLDRRAGRVANPERPRPEPGHHGLHRRDHQKILVVDDEIAFTGGINIGDEYVPAPAGGAWHDLQVRIEGPAVLGLADAFRRAWLQAEGEPFAAPARPAASSSAMKPALAHTCDNFGRRHRTRMHVAYRHAIHRAQTAISITNAYFIPDALLRRALYRAVRRGVSVRILVPSNSDVRFVWFGSRYLFDRLLRRGVRIFEYPGPMMHAKAGVIDGTWATIGSFNLDRRSMLHNLEAGLVVLDHGFARTLEQQFEHDIAQCREIKLAHWRERAVAQRFIEWFAHLFAYWL